MTCPNCKSEEWTLFHVRPGEGDPSKTYCVCPCGAEFPEPRSMETVTDLREQEKLEWARHALQDAVSDLRAAGKVI